MSPPRRAGGAAARARCRGRSPAAQERVWERDPRATWPRRIPMHRLLQGDVGSGKTIVAALAVLTAVEAGYQAAVMAPTEILAEQHFMTFRRLLEPLGRAGHAAHLGAQGRASATARRAALAAGEIGCVVGTHALVQEARRLPAARASSSWTSSTASASRQRARLRGKGEHPDVLVMTATPIPRTLALTLYGDLDVSVLDELPPGRQPDRHAWPAPRASAAADLRVPARAGRRRPADLRRLPARRGVRG